MAETASTAGWGEVEAQAFARDHAPWLFRWFERRVATSTQAEDLAQETLLRFLARGPSRTEALRAGSYLCGIARLVLKDAHRSERRRLARLAALPVPDSDRQDSPDLDLAAALRALPVNLELVIDVLFARGLTLDEAARLLGWSRSTVQSRYRSALKRLRKQLGDREGVK